MPAGFPNPDKLNPLSDHAWDVLWLLSKRERASYQINAGVLERLRREGLISQNGSFTRITNAGRVKLAMGER